jgi:hypothetical protein
MYCRSAQSRYKTHSDRKSLIHIGLKVCFFHGQSSQSLDFQGFRGRRDRFSTKLSTETRPGTTSAPWANWLFRLSSTGSGAGKDVRGPISCTQRPVQNLNQNQARAVWRHRQRENRGLSAAVAALQALVMVPEINLTPQLEERFVARFAPRFGAGAPWCRCTAA